jgi:hypothetical protein
LVRHAINAKDDPNLADRVRLMAIAAAPQLAIDHRVAPQTLWLSQ